MSILIAQILVSFLVTGFAKAQTRLAGTQWLVGINVAVSLIQSACVVWQGGSASDMEALLTMLVNTAITAGGAYVVHKLSKTSYK